MFEIKPIKGHYEVYLDGHFFCSTDTESEAETEIKNYTDGDESYENSIHNTRV